jgi:hypothetical protein
MPTVTSPSTDFGIPDLETAGRKIVDEGGIIHKIKHVPVAACIPPTMKSKFTPATGNKLGQPVTLVLRYLSGQSLERLGLKTPGIPNPILEPRPESLSPRSRIPVFVGPVDSRVEMKQEDAMEGDQRAQRAGAPEPEQLPGNIVRGLARERQRRLDQLRLEEIALEKEEIAIRRRMIENEE